MPYDDFLTEGLAAAVNRQDRLVWRGRHLHTRFLLENGPTAHLISIDAGQVRAVRRGPFVMPHWQFALRAGAEDWAQFWSPDPKPGYHDLMALIRYKRLRAEGDLHPFMSHLLYFKDVLACPRQTGSQP
ncbi:hypothetical protein [Bordetella sp. N]|uniref:hypothetical protein n=1 Tax=Bordetella sp. N TaxID=1746199 RepID=UPI00070AE06F|nr:hypothetical protein [Bordetella sp. N]ALM82693.1 hypothetical protein ASB57_06745 [Bordetella sp. N]